MITVRRAMWIAVLSLIGTIAGWYLVNHKLTYTAPITIAATVVKPNKPLTDFTLTDINNRTFNAKSLRGHWSLVFFGYANCPDICPQTLGLVREAWESFAATNRVPARFIFVNLAPAPISITELNAFVKNYNPDFIGVTGTKSEIHKLGDQLGIFSTEQNGKLDHTASLMLIDPQGRLQAVFSPPFSHEDLVKDLKLLTHA